MQAVNGFDETWIPRLLDRVPAAVTMIDPDGVILYYNAYSAEILERSPDLLGTDIRLCHKSSESIEKIDRMLRAFREGRQDPFVYETERLGRRIRVTLLPVYAGGRQVGCLHFVVVKP